MKLTIQTIRPAKGSKHRVKRIGRGNASGHGTYSTRGGKGQTARSGGSHRLRLKAFKRLMQSTPKLSGFKSLRIKPAEVQFSILEKKFQANETVDLKTLKERHIIGKNALAAKVIGNGELTKKLILSGVACSKSAKSLIEKVGGEVK